MPKRAAITFSLRGDGGSYKKSNTVSGQRSNHRAGFRKIQVLHTVATDVITQDVLYAFHISKRKLFHAGLKSVTTLVGAFLGKNMW